jgi:hypothetical protein
MATALSGRYFSMATKTDAKPVVATLARSAIPSIVQIG